MSTFLVVDVHFFIINFFIISDAIESVRKRAYDLVLSDYDLDDGKGDEFVAFLKGRGINIPVIACSSHDRGNEALVSAEVVAVCSKMKFSEIEAVIESVCM